MKTVIFWLLITTGGESPRFEKFQTESKSDCIAQRDSFGTARYGDYVFFNGSAYVTCIKETKSE